MRRRALFGLGKWRLDRPTNRSRSGFRQERGRCVSQPPMSTRSLPAIGHLCARAGSPPTTFDMAVVARSITRARSPGEGRTGFGVWAPGCAGTSARAAQRNTTRRLADCSISWRLRTYLPLRHCNGMAKGSIKVGDEVAITATVRKRVTEDRISVLIPSYHQPHSIVDTTPHISSGQQIELWERSHASTRTR